MFYASAFLFPILMLFAAWMDLFTMRIANWISIVLTLAFLPMGFACGLRLGLIGQHYLCGLAVLAPTFAFFAFGKIGGGDAKLAASSAIWMGWAGLFDYLIVSSLLGGVLAVAILAARQVPLPLFLMRWTWVARLHEPKTGIPFGVALGAGAIIVYPQTAIWMAAVGG